MPLRPCIGRLPDGSLCSQLADGSYCERHRPQHGSRAWRTGSSRAWRELRARALLRDGSRCVRCGATEPLAVHHVVPIAEGGSMTLDNLTVLCEDCHRAAHRPPAA